MAGSEQKRTRGLVGDGYLDRGRDGFDLSENGPVIVTVELPGGDEGIEAGDTRLSIAWPNTGADAYADLAPVELDALITQLIEARDAGR